LEARTSTRAAASCNENSSGSIRLASNLCSVTTPTLGRITTRLLITLRSGPRSGALRTPGFWNLDTSLTKKFSITESRYFEFRWEMFNALNLQNLGYPNPNFCLSPGPNGEVDNVRQAGCSFGRITNIQTDPRAMQFALKLYFWNVIGAGEGSGAEGDA